MQMYIVDLDSLNMKMLKMLRMLLVCNIYNVLSEIMYPFTSYAFYKENMDGAEICGKFIKVHVAKPTSKIQHGKSAWSAEEWIESNLEENETNEDTVLQE